MSKFTELKRINVITFQKMKEAGEPITCLTAYDYTSARILDESGIELILVGDSLGMVMNGEDTTIPVTLDEIIYHTKAVSKGLKRAFLVSDMPFGTYNISIEKALENSVRVLKETSAQALKIEGGKEVAPLVNAMFKAGINVMGHIGLMPQSVHVMGGFRVQGKNGAEKLIEDAVALEEAGAFAIVLEGIVKDVAQKITDAVKIPTIGIGAGAGCDGQVLVYHDVFGMFDDFTPKFVKKYCNAKELIAEAAKEYISEVKNKKFPSDEHSF